MLGLHDELLAVVASWKDDRYRDPSGDHTAYHVPQVLALGLGSSALVSEHVRRMKLPLRTADVNDHTKPFFAANVTAVIEHTGYPIGSFEYAEPQTIDRLYFIAGLDPEARWKQLALRVALLVSFEVVAALTLDDFTICGA